MRKVVEIRDKANGVLEFHMVNMDSWNWFEYLRNTLQASLGVTLIKDIDGIWVREAIMQVDSFEFKLMFHEDVGNYLFTEPPSEIAEERLRAIVSRLFSEVRDVKCD